MDIEGLSKTQIVLLTLLVSFVTSIATGIVTVSLLDQAPPGVTQTVHKVVERTVERVVPRSGQTAAAGESVREVTTVVKEHDLITESIAENVRSVVRIYTGTGTSTDAVGPLVGLGMVVRSGGLVATDRALLTGSAYSLEFADGTVAPATIANAASVDRIALLKADVQAETQFRSVAFADSGSLKLGQSVITLSGATRDTVATGIIAALEERPTATNTPATIALIRTDITANDTLPGSPLVNIFNEVVGVRAVQKNAATTHATYIPVIDIRTAVDAYTTAQAATTTPETAGE